MRLIADAFQALCSCVEESPSTRAVEWLHRASICASDMGLDQLLGVPALAAAALYAVERYVPPEAEQDIVLASDWWDVQQRLLESLDRHASPAGAA